MQLCQHFNYVLSVTGLQNNGSVHTENKTSVKGMWHSEILFFNEHECQSYETCVKANIFQSQVHKFEFFSHRLFGIT